MHLSEVDQWNSLVARVLRIESVTLGDLHSKDANYLALFRGRLVDHDSEAAYERLSESLRSLDITPLFRADGEDHIVILLPGFPKPKPSNPLINLILFALTLVSVFAMGFFFAFSYAYRGPITSDWRIMLPHLNGVIGIAAAFTASMLGILLAHEFGHYFMARYHKTAASLPYFIPLPFLSPLGTMGAVIVQKESHKNKRVLLDIGLAGPLAGMAVAVPVLLIGLSLSHLNPIPLAFPEGEGLSMEGNSILYLLAKFIVFGHWLPQPASYGNLSPALYWAVYFFTGQPVPLGGLDVNIHPVAFAGWAGLLVTSLNLIPAGQLDGGHIINSLLGRRAEKLRPFVLIALLLLGMVWMGWWLWAFLIFFLGRAYAEPLDQITPLDNRRKLLAIITLIIFVLVFTPVPLKII